MTLNTLVLLASSHLSHRARGALLAAACAAVAYAPRVADACGAPEPGLSTTTPADGATYPANAALLFWGYDISLDAVTVTVDGQPAKLVPAGFASGFATIAALVEPAPLEGQTVVVAGSFCEPGFCDQMQELTYTAGPPDLEAPEPVAAASFFAIYDHADFQSSGGDCLSDSQLTVYVHVMQDTPGPGAAPGGVRASWDGGGGPGGFGGFRITSGGMSRLAIPIVEAQLGGKDPRSEVCVTVAAIDAAGNAAEPFTLCPACFYRADDGENDGGIVPEPLWTEADAVPGSACAGAEETTGGASDSGPDPTDGPGSASASDSSGEAPTTGGPQTTGEPQTDGASDTSDQDDGGDKGCACDGAGGGRDLGALVVVALGLGLGRRRR